MKFALNYSHPAAALLRAGDIELDLWKCPDWVDLVDEVLAAHPVYVHFPFQVGQGGFDPERLDAAAQLADKTATFYINAHISPRLEDLGADTSAAHVIELALRDTLHLTHFFGAERVILENIPYPESPPYLNNKPETITLPEVIREVINQGGVGLLLDIGHARRSAIHFGMDTRDYIRQLPLDRLRELHITGVGANPQGGITDHLAMTDADWDLFGWVLDQVRTGTASTPGIVACEYGGLGEGFAWRNDPAVMQVEVPRMLAMVRAAEPQPAH